MTPVQKDPHRGLNGALAAEIRSELAVRQLTQTWLAEASQIERLTLRRYLNGDRPINTAVAESIAEALGLDAAELLLRAVHRRDANWHEYGPESRSVEQWALYCLDRGKQDIGLALHEAERLLVQHRISPETFAEIKEAVIAIGPAGAGVMDYAAREEDEGKPKGRA